MDERKKSTLKSRSKCNMKRLRQVALVGAPIVCLLLCQPASAFFNCFTPNMFKMGQGKVGHPGGPFGPHSGERANWYPQMNVYQSYGGNPMSRLFKQKWMGGGGLFGPKRWMDWRMNAANMNYYRPNQFAYWPPTAPAAPSSFLGGKQGYNQFSDQLNSPPYSSSMQLLPPTTNGNSGYNAPGSYGQSPSSQLNGGIGPSLPTTINNNNDGWSYPSVSPYSRPGTNQLYNGDSYSVSPNNYQSAKQQADQYGTKGGSGTKTGKKPPN